VERIPPLSIAVERGISWLGQPGISQPYSRNYYEFGRLRQSVRKQLMQSIEILRSLYYLTQNLHEEGRKDIQKLMENTRILSDSDLQEELRRVRFQIERIKNLVGCKLSDDEINRSVKWLTSAGDGYVGLSKRHIERGFNNYTYVFPRWPHIPGHTHVQFDSNIGGESPYKIFLAEELLFSDIRLLWP
jgi:hypothetical protein